MFKILHIPTAKYISDYDHFIRQYSRENYLSGSDIRLDTNLGESYLAPVLFITKDIARNYLHSFTKIDISLDTLVLISTEDYHELCDIPNLNFNQFEIIADEAV